MAGLWLQDTYSMLDFDVHKKRQFWGVKWQSGPYPTPPMTHGYKKFPLNLIFDLIVHVAGISRWQIFILVIASRYCFECILNKNTNTAEINLKSGQKQILLKRLNTLSLWLGCLGALGISLVANFQVFRDIPMPPKSD